jgi:beta-glucosidase
VGRTQFIWETKLILRIKANLQTIAVAKQADVVVMVLGEHGLQSGEGRSRSDIGLPGVQQELWKPFTKLIQI